MAKPLIIGVDIRDLKIAKTGTLTYLEEVCKEFKKLEGTEYKFHFFSPLLPPYTGKNKLLKLLGHLRYQFWKQISLPLHAWLKGCDILFCTDNVAPMAQLGFKTVPVFHDAFFWENPEHFNKLWLWLTTHTAIPAARRSPIVVTTSEHARQQIHWFTGIPLHKLVVVYEGPKSLPLAPSAGAVDYGKYLLHVGVLNKRKNIPFLIRAFAALKDSGHSELKLVLAGKSEALAHSNDDAEIQNALRETGLQEEVIFLGYVSDEELAVLYQNALAYVFPSLNEGFGIPVLEAFRFDLPVVVADNSALPEIGGDAVLAHRQGDIQDLVRQLKMVLEDESLRQRLILSGRLRLADFSWEKTARSLLVQFLRAL